LGKGALIDHAAEVLKVWPTLDQCNGWRPAQFNPVLEQLATRIVVNAVTRLWLSRSTAGRQHNRDYVACSWIPENGIFGKIEGSPGMCVMAGAQGRVGHTSGRDRGGGPKCRTVLALLVDGAVKVSG
jgi:hypothetical protein